MITFKKLDNSHLELIRRWRNENRQYFFDTNEVNQAAHAKWYQKYLESIQYIIYIIFINDEPIGTVGVQWAGDNVWFENVLLGDKKYARKGYMYKAIEILIDSFKAKLYVVDVKKDNDAAIKFYEKLGFITEQVKDNSVYMVKRKYDTTT